MASKSRERFKLNRRNLQEYPNFHDSSNDNLWESKKNFSYEELLNNQIQNHQEERPTVLRSYVVDEYVQKILNKTNNPKDFQNKLKVVKKILELKMDNRVLNSMRQFMNE